MEIRFICARSSHYVRIEHGIVLKATPCDINIQRIVVYTYYPSVANKNKHTKNRNDNFFSAQTKKQAPSNFHLVQVEWNECDWVSKGGEAIIGSNNNWNNENDNISGTSPHHLIYGNCAR